MSYSSGIITAPVSIRDVQNALGVSSTDLGTLCTSGRINKFARYKPVRFASVAPITNANRRSVAQGLVLPSPVTGSSKTGALIRSACEGDWGYNLPLGGASSPYRLTDFANPENRTSYGYDHNAVPPIQVNYPRDGWQYVKGSGKNLLIYVDLDPGDSATNLQSDDLTAAGINLNEWTLICYVDWPIQRIYESDDTILNGGQISGNTILINNLNVPSAYTNVEVYICMYRMNGSTVEFQPLPKQGDFNPQVFYLDILDDAEASGGGVPGSDTEEMFKNVEFSYNLNGTYHYAWDCTDNGTALYCMKSLGSLYVKMNLRNTSGNTSTVQRGHFQLDLNGTGLVSATTMYNSSKQSVSSVSIPNNTTVTIYLFFDAIFNRLPSAEWNTSNKNSSWSMDFVRNGATLFGGDIYAMYSGTEGWVTR